MGSPCSPGRSPLGPLSGHWAPLRPAPHAPAQWTSGRGRARCARAACWGFPRARPRAQSAMPTHLPGPADRAVPGGGSERCGGAAGSGGAGSSRPDGGPAASARAALYPGGEAPRRRPVTPGPAGPCGLPPRHSHAPARRPTPAADSRAARHRSRSNTSEATSASPGRTTTSGRQARPRSAEWPAVAAGTRSADNHWRRWPPLSTVLRIYWT